MKLGAVCIALMLAFAAASFAPAAPATQTAPPQRAGVVHENCANLEGTANQRCLCRHKRKKSHRRNCLRRLSELERRR